MLLTFFTVFTVTLILWKQWWGKLHSPQHESIQWRQTLLEIIVLFTPTHSQFKRESQFHLGKSVTAPAKSLQSCPTLCDPADGSPPGSPVPGILQARTLEWVAISFSIARKWKVKVKPLSHVRLLATPWTEARQAPPSMGFSRQEYWSGVPLLSLEYPLTRQ